MRAGGGAGSQSTLEAEVLRDNLAQAADTHPDDRYRPTLGVALGGDDDSLGDGELVHQLACPLGGISSPPSSACSSATSASTVDSTAGLSPSPASKLAPSIP